MVLIVALAFGFPIVAHSGPRENLAKFLDCEERPFSAVEAPASQSASVSAASEDSLFQRLTHGEWSGAGCAQARDPLPGTCQKLRLGRDGNYTWIAMSDVTERNDKGRWNFTSSNDHSGVLLFENGSSLVFNLTGDHLKVGPIEFTVGEAKPAANSRGSRAALPTFAQQSMGKQVGDWEKTNDFDLSRFPQSLGIHRDGTFKATYRGGQCHHSGTVSIDKSRLLFQVQPNTCDERDGGSPAQLSASPGVSPIHEDKFLILHSASYRSVHCKKKYWLAEPYGRSVRLEGVYQGEVGSQQTTSMDLYFANTGDQKVDLDDLQVTAIALKKNGGGFSYEGKDVILLSEKFRRLSLKTGEEVRRKVVFKRIAGARFTHLAIKLNYRDSSQTYSLMDSRIVSHPAP